MCFSPEADVVAGIVVSGVGVDALRHVRQTREYPLASLPLLLGTHLLVETFVWWGVTERVSGSVGRAAVWLYLVFALGVLPVLVPVAIIAIEPAGWRRRLLLPFVAVGAVVAVLLLAVVITGPVSAQVEGCCLSYNIGLGFSGQIGALYVLVTCISLLASSYRRIVEFGVINLVAVAVLAWLLASGLASLWCAWAAVTSAFIAAHLRRAGLPGSNRHPIDPDPVVA
jgi:hypothetical protein